MWGACVYLAPVFLLLNAHRRASCFHKLDPRVKIFHSLFFFTLFDFLLAFALRPPSHCTGAYSHRAFPSLPCAFPLFGTFSATREKAKWKIRDEWSKVAKGRAKKDKEEGEKRAREEARGKVKRARAREASTSGVHSLPLEKFS